MGSIVSVFYERLARSFPKLELGLDRARINKNPSLYVKESLFLSVFISIGISFVLMLFILTFKLSFFFVPLGFIISFFFMFYVLMNKPQYSLFKTEKYIEGEIVSMIRFLVLEIKTERSIYRALINTSENFVITGIYFDEIIDRVKLGKTLEQAINEAVELCPSSHLRNVYWQLLNSLQTGSDITISLSVLLDDIVEEQKIRIEEYGRELNALSLFYMMVAIIVPTVGFTIVSAILTFVGFPIPLGLLITLWVVLTLVQYFFLMMSSSRRPAVEAY